MNTIKTIRIDDTKTIFVGADSWRVGKPDSTEIDRAKPQVDVVTADLEASGWQNAAEFAARLRRGQP